jgi:hypothetical protein
MPSRINQAWHSKHRMPARATLEQRIRWHLAHARHCACREIPRTVLAALEQRGVKPPRARP